MSAERSNPPSATGEPSDDLTGAVIFDVLIRHRHVDEAHMRHIAHRFVHGVTGKR